MRVLLDTDVLLDFFLAREPFVDKATELIELHEQGGYDGYVSAITPVNLFYITRKMKGIEGAKEIVTITLATFGICPITAPVLEAAGLLPMKDYEDAVQHASAAVLHLDAIVTRNHKDYGGATLAVYEPAGFLAQFQQPPQDDALDK